jgi:hypothetical protein
MPKSIQAEVEIDAVPSRVWAILSDVSRYPEWNPFVRQWDGELRVGNRVSIRLQGHGGRVYGFRPVLRVVDPEREIRWLGKLGPGGFFDGEHSLRVEPLGTGRTRFVQSERFSGILVPFLRGTVAGAAAGFAAMNAALKLRVEGGRTGIDTASAVR